MKEKLKVIKGITLIALIITIIVMLILVAATITVALNGGLFQTAKKSAKDTQIESDKEVLCAATVAAMDNLIIPNAQSLLDNLPQDWTATGADGGPYTCTSPKGNEFQVTANGTITVKEDLGLSDLEKYILGEEGTGRSLWDIMNQQMQFIDDNDTEIDESETISFVNYISEDSNIYFYINYNNDGNVYKFKVIYENDTDSFRTERISDNMGVKTIEIDDKVGKYVSFDTNNDATIANDGSELYIVLYNDTTHGTQIISANSLKVNNNYFNLGTYDSTLTSSEIAAVDELIGLTTQEKENLSNEMRTDLTDLEKGIASYNKAITTLNNACGGLVNDNISYVELVRSVGSNPISKNSENTTPYESDNLEIWPLLTSNYSHLTGKLNGVRYSTDNNYEEDLDRMAILGITKTENEYGYWMASRIVGEDSDDALFSMHYVDSGGDFDDNYLWYVNKYSAHGYTFNSGLRPVVTLNSNVQFTGEGTKASPYTISVSE